MYRYSRPALLLIVVVVFCASVVAQSIESLMSSGQELLQRGAYNQAVTAFRQVLSREPDNFEAQFNLGFAYLQWGRHGNAIDEFKKALKWQPRNSEVWSNLAIAYENQGKSQDAINALHHSVEIDGSNTTARMNLAAMYANANQVSAAIAQYKKVISIDGSNVEALTNLSTCLIGAGQTNEAKTYLKQALASDPNNGAAHWELGNIYWKKEGNIDKGISEYRTAIAVQPDQAGFYENLSLALEEKGNTAEAIEILKKSLVYTDDALRKEKIQERIDRLERGDTGASAKTSDPQKVNVDTKSQIADLRKELGKGDAAPEARRHDTKPVNIMGDLQELENNPDNGLDLKEEAKRRAGTKE